jgi:cytochrome c oxidase cbb3-type subunit 3
MTSSKLPTEANPDSSTGDGPLTTHVYDGIAEYDNPLPAWWRRVFWATFTFSLGYFVHYQLTGNGASVEASYAEDMRVFREEVAAQSLGKEITEEGLHALMTDPVMLKDARLVFNTRCAQCHAARGQGDIGPNLTDDHWLNGNGSLMSLHEIVSNGRQQKGMPAWGSKLRPVELAQVVAFVGSIRNTNVPGRPPQGTRVEPAAQTVGASTTGG